MMLKLKWDFQKVKIKLRSQADIKVNYKQNKSEN